MHWQKTWVRDKAHDESSGKHDASFLKEDGASVALGESPTTDLTYPLKLVMLGSSHRQRHMWMVVYNNPLLNTHQGVGGQRNGVTQLAYQKEVGGGAWQGASMALTRTPTAANDPPPPFLLPGTYQVNSQAA